MGVHVLLVAVACTVVLSEDWPAEPTPDIDELIGRLDDDKRLRATVRLLRRTGAPGVSALAEALGHDDATMRLRVAYALGQFGSVAAPAVPQLIIAMNDADWRIQEAAAHSLGAIGPTAADAVPALVKALTDEDWRVRAAAAEALGGIGPEARSAVDNLVSLLDDRSAASIAAIRGLGGIGPPADVSVPGLVGLLTSGMTGPSVQGEVLRSLAEMGQPAVEELVRGLNREDDNQRVLLVWALGNMGPQASEALPQLIGLATRDASAEVRSRVAYALANIDDEGSRAVPTLTTLLADESFQVRVAAAGALGLLGPRAKSAARSLLPMLAADREGWVEPYEAACALGSIGEDSREVILALRVLLKHESPHLRAAAAAALDSIVQESRQIKTRMVKSAMEAALWDQDERVRLHAARILGRARFPPPEAIETLAGLVRDWEVSMACSLEAMATLGHLGPRARTATPAIIEALHGFPVLTAAAAEALHKVGTSDVHELQLAEVSLRSLLNESDAVVRVAAAVALWRMCGLEETTVRVVISAIDDNDPDARAAAADALGAMSDGMCFVPYLSDLLGDEDGYVAASAAVALWKCTGEPDQSVRRLLVLLGSGGRSPCERVAAAQALAEIPVRTEEIQASLMTATTDSDRVVRRAAAHALNTLCAGTR